MPKAKNPRPRKQYRIINGEEAFTILKQEFGLEAALQFHKKYGACLIRTFSWDRLAVQFMQMDMVLDSRRGMNIQDLANKYHQTLIHVETILKAHGESWELEPQNAAFVLVCRVCGFRGRNRTLVKHIREHGLTSAQYEETYGVHVYDRMMRQNLLAARRTPEALQQQSQRSKERGVQYWTARKRALMTPPIL